MKRSAAKTLFAAFAFLAIAVSQVFGLVQGYICHCHEIPVSTEAEHCHVNLGPCEEIPAGDDRPCDSSGAPRQHHHKNLVKVEAASPVKNPSAPAPVFAVITSLLSPLDLLRPLTETVRLREPRRTSATGPPPTAQMVTQCMVLLV